MSIKIGLRKKVVDTLILVAKNMGSPLEVSKELRVSVSEARTLLEEVRRLGLANLDEHGKYCMDIITSSAISTLLEKYPLRKILSGITPVVLEAMMEPMTVAEVAKKIGVERETVYRVIRRLPQIIQRSERGYQLIGDPVLRYIIIQFAKVARKVGFEFEEIVRLNAHSLVRTVKPLSAEEGEPTAFTAFGRYGIGLAGGREYYYVVPPRRLSPEEVLLHALKVSKNADDRAKAALLYAKLLLEGKTEGSKLIALANKLDPSGELRKIVYDMDRYVRGLSLDRPELFIPRRELLGYAETYGINIRQLEPAPISEDFFWKLGGALENRVEAYLFGGAAMMLRGYKAATVDVDLAVRSHEYLVCLDKALRLMGYKLVGDPDEGSLERGVPRIYSNGERPKVEVYLGKISGKVTITGSMLMVGERREYGNLILVLASDEDSVLLKLLTERLRDLMDAELIIRGRKEPLDWDAIADRIIEQHSIMKSYIGITFFDGIRDLIEVRGIFIPRNVVKKFKSLMERQAVEYAVNEMKLKDLEKVSEVTGIPKSKLKKILSS
ncbi:MAG: hypothetical protein B9J98_04005 [Candidatus Terraquivivens tikiterensis]|uniref:Uncharacterized protein n=1 Tax=Candidatus Terraquivivens tikiterensis TaxID=1980982 RepID=A0A2R7Y533_9ARCH|nr:MAG: hypothetical protein B9J98_04005 [Candidatus Terraquivivens tikiterensis]